MRRIKDKREEVSLAEGMEMATKEKKFYRVRDVMAEFCVARSTIWRWCKNGIFPQPRRFGQDGKLIGWCVEDIEVFKASIKNVSV